MSPSRVRIPRPLPLVVNAGDQVAAADDLRGGAGEPDVEALGLEEEHLVAGIRPSASGPAAMTMPIWQSVSALAGRISPARVSASSSVVSITRKSSSGSSESRIRARDLPARFNDTPGMASPFVELEVGGRSRQGHEPGQGLFSCARRDEARPGEVLHRRRRRHRAGAVRTALPAEAAAGGRRRRGDLAEARAREAAGLDRDCRVTFPSGRHADELCVTELAHVVWAANLATLEFGAWPSRRATRSSPTSSGSTSTRSRARGSRRRSSVAAIVHEMLDEIGYVGWPKTSGNRGVHVYCRIEPKWEFKRGAPLRARVRARDRAARARPRHDGVVERGARREGVRRLQPERARPDDPLRVLGARPADATVSAPLRGTSCPTSRPRTSRSRRCRRASRSSATCTRDRRGGVRSAAYCSSGWSGKSRRGVGERRICRTSRRCRASRSACSPLGRRRLKTESSFADMPRCQAQDVALWAAVVA